MARNFSFEVEEEFYQKLIKLFKNDEEALREYIIQSLKEKFENNETPEKDNLESYLNKGTTGSRNYGVKGQGW